MRLTVGSGIARSIPSCPAVEAPKLGIWPLRIDFGSVLRLVVASVSLRKPGSISRRLCATAACSTLAAFGASSEAEEPPGVTLRWSAPATCPGGADVEARVRRLLGGAEGHAQVGLKERITADGTIVLVNGRYQLKLAVRQGGQAVGGARVFESESCESLAGAAAVTLALFARGEAPAASPPDSGAARPTGPAASPESTAPAPPTGSPSATSATSAPTPSPSAPPQPPPAPPSPSTPAALAAPEAAPSPPRSVDTPTTTAPDRSAGAPHGTVNRTWFPEFELPILVTDEGVTPSWGYGLGLGVGVRIRQLQIRASGAIWLPQDDAEGGGGGPATASTVRYSRATAGLSGCYGVPLASFELAPCLLARLEHVSGRGNGPEIAPESNDAWWVEVGLGARAQWSLRSWAALFVRPSLLFATSRPTFAVDGVGALHHVAGAAVAFELGCEWIL